MAHRFLALALVVLGSAILLVNTAAAQWALSGGYVVPTNSSTITVDVLPLDAEVRLNGVLLGTAHDLMSKPIFVVPGEHRLEFSAPGHLLTTMQVIGIPDWTSRVQIVLVPDRRP